MSESPISSLDIKKGSGKLECLKLRSTLLTKFDATNSDLSALRELHLSLSPIKVFKLGKKVYNFQTLKLDYTPLEVFSTLDYDLNNLDLLDISGSNISVLDLSNGAKTLSTLYMQSTRIEHLDANMLPYKTLQTIDASFSPIKNVNFSGVARSRIVQLRLVDTKLTSFSSKGCNFPFIKEIDLSGSPVQDIDLSKGVESLERLGLQASKLSAFNENMINTPAIQYLDLSQTNITTFHIPSTFTKLTELYLDDSKLTCFSSSSILNLELWYISLNRANITELDISSFPNLKILSLFSNPMLYSIYYNATHPQTSLIIDMDQKFASCDCCWYHFQNSFRLRNKICPDIEAEKNCSLALRNDGCGHKQIKCEGKYLVFWDAVDCLGVGK